MNLVDKIRKTAKELGLDRRLSDLTERIAHDEHPQLDEAYLFSNTVDNEQSLFEAAVQLQQASLATKFLIIDDTEASDFTGFPGYEKWYAALGEMIGRANIFGVPLIPGVPLSGKFNVNTLSESRSLVTYAEAQRIHSLYAVAAPFHQLRAFMTAASEAIRQEEHGGQLLNIFNYLGAEQPWDEEVTHSQGILKATREGLIWHELKRIKDYANILPVNCIIEYMDRRALQPPATVTVK